MQKETKVFYIDQPHELRVTERIKRILYPFYNLALKVASLFLKKDERKTKYSLSMCSCFKNEAAFLKEWIEYHLFIGYDHFYLYNNNSTDNYEEVLQPYVNSGVVTLIEFPVVPVQVAAYKHFYDTYRGETKWVSFFDIDEFVCLYNDENIIEWLGKFSKYPVVYVYWKYFGSSGLMDHDYNKLVLEQYTCATDKYVNIGKTFYNTRYEIANFDKTMVHFLTAKWKGIKIPAVNEAGNFTIWGIQKIRRKDFTIQLNHYWSKAFNLYIEKYKKGSSANGTLWKKLWVYKETEHLCKDVDVMILRFLTELKLRMAGIDENKVLD